MTTILSDQSHNLAAVKLTQEILEDLKPVYKEIR